MLTEAQRLQMLTAMGIDVYRLRNPAASDVREVRIFLDARARVCVSGVVDVASLSWLPPALRIAAAELRIELAPADDGVLLPGATLPSDAAAKRALWQALKPLARRLRAVN